MTLIHTNWGTNKRFGCAATKQINTQANDPNDGVE